jgi:hypothetical protein
MHGRVEPDSVETRPSAPLVTLRSSLRMLPTSRNQPTPDDRRSPIVPPRYDHAAFREPANVHVRPSWTAASPPRLAHEAGGHPDGPHPPVKAEPTAPRCASVILTDRATSVPFTAVLNGPERTTTDNHEAASTCAVSHPRTWQQRPNWLWEQGVGLAEACIGDGTPVVGPSAMRVRGGWRSRPWRSRSGSDSPGRCGAGRCCTRSASPRPALGPRAGC